MPTFALDTSTPRPSLAIVHEGRVVARAAPGDTPAAGRRVLEEVHALLTAAGLTAAQLTRIVVGTGPGGFTGLRIGLATAAGLAQGLRVPVVGASSLGALAMGMATATDAGVLVPLTDARRGEVFAAAYAREGLAQLRPPAAVPLSQLPTWLGELGASVAVAGTGAALLDAPPAGVHRLPEGDPAHTIAAEHLVGWADTFGAAPPTPVYARLPDAEVNRLRAQGMPVA